VSFENPRDPLSIIPTNIQGSDRLKMAIIDICKEFETIFSRSVKFDTASVPTMKLKVDKDI
jgi:hypothetical protein